ncbi:hypothetical protein EC988_000670 [Linderina pennispora]|nr:hypothetical protein EC988_000670 [Linderina pennispora]
MDGDRSPQPPAATDWMYDDRADDQDAQYVSQTHPGKTDAVLSCPMCFTQVCFTCQSHVKFPGQYRALSIVHCHIDASQLFVYKRKGLTRIDSMEEARPSDVYRAVVCDECGTSVGVVDADNVYHLFHVLTDT